MFQSGLSRIDFTARCAGGDASRHDLCLQKLKRFENELKGVLSERWEGCTYAELCLAPGPHMGSIPMHACKHAVERGEVSVTVGEDAVPLVSLLGSDGVSPLEPEAQRTATTLQFVRAMAAGLASEFGGTATARRFCVDLDSEVNHHLGGTFADGCLWSAKLLAAGCTAAVAGEDLAQTERDAATTVGQSRACALLGALGRLYERAHLMLAEGLATMGEALARLLLPFEWLHPLVMQLVESHGLWDIEMREVVRALAIALPEVSSLPEGVPPQPAGVIGGQFEPEPEPA